MMTKGKIYRCVVKWDGLEVNYQKKNPALGWISNILED